MKIGAQQRALPAFRWDEPDHEIRKAWARRLQPWAEYCESLTKVQKLLISATQIDVFERKVEADLVKRGFMKRGRGQQANVSGGGLIKQHAIRLLRKRKDILKSQGYETHEAWEIAYREVAALFNVRHNTLRDWYRRPHLGARTPPIALRRSSAKTG